MTLGTSLSDTLGICPAGNVGRRTLLMAAPATTIVITVCPKGHERCVTVLEESPECSWTLTCPLCGEEQEIVLPEIVSADP